MTELADVQAAHAACSHPADDGHVQMPVTKTFRPPHLECRLTVSGFIEWRARRQDPER